MGFFRLLKALLPSSSSLSASLEVCSLKDWPVRCWELGKLGPNKGRQVYGAPRSLTALPQYGVYKGNGGTFLCGPRANYLSNTFLGYQPLPPFEWALLPLLGVDSFVLFRWVLWVANPSSLVVVSSE